jgi:hypothetical protein
MKIPVSECPERSLHLILAKFYVILRAVVQSGRSEVAPRIFDCRGSNVTLHLKIFRTLALPLKGKGGVGFTL